MDRPLLHPLVERLRADERLPAFAAALPTRARVSEPALPLLLAALYEELERPLCVLAARRRRRARRSPRRSAGSSARTRSRCFPSRGVHWGSGLEPPPHLVGERARALDVLARGGLVCSSALALAEPLPPPAARPAPIRVARGEEPGIDAARRGARARRLRARRAGRGARPVRGSRRARRRLPDDRPRAAADRALRRRDRGHPRVLAVHAARAARASTSATIYAGGRAARASWSSRRSLDDEEDAPRRRPRRPRAAARPRRPTSSGSPTRCARSGREEGLAELSLDGATELDPLPQGQPFSFDAQRPALVARGLSEAENELSGLLRQGLDVVVAFAHRGEAERQRHLLRRARRADARARRDAGRA